MPKLKSYLKSPFAQAVAAFVLSLFIRLIFLSSTKIRRIDEAAMPYMRGDANAIFAFWHGRMMVLPAFCPPRRQMRVLISRHRDGTLISRVIGHFGQKTVSGSTSKGGKEAASEILRALERGDNISITPDGPRGPAQIAARGVAAVARMSGKPVLPVTFVSTREKRAGSWDRFAIALPFGSIFFLVGAPIWVAPDVNDAQEEEARLDIENAMNQLVHEAQRAAHG